MQKNLKWTTLHSFFILYKKLAPYSTKFLAFFEPVIPFLVTLYLRKELEVLMRNEKIKTYYLEFVRISKFRYTIKFSFIATSNQIVSIISNGINDVMRSLQNG